VPAFPIIGILGAGQLGRMTALAALRMGLQVRFLSPEPSGAVAGLGESIVGDWTDAETLRRFAEGCAAVTVESEWAPCERMAEVLPEGTLLYPKPLTVLAIRDKGVQKQTLRDAGLPVPSFVRAPNLEEALEAAAGFGFPCLLKRFRGSYDGYGNATVDSPRALADAWSRLAAEDGLLVEAFVPFVRELAVLVARRADGESVVYPVALTEQRDHRCHAVTVPAGIDDAVAARALEVGLRAVEAVDGVGITAVEVFETSEGRILVNEMAPRPHNTGHYSIDACHTSQFENHVRAILGLPLGDPSLRTPASVMVNVLGHRSGAPRMDGYGEALRIPGAVIHLYGKESVKPRRKMGHVTVTGSDPVEARRLAEEAAALIQL
jgi:5-(carboxyamino)imidazole ribonucleotide synthase